MIDRRQPSGSAHVSREQGDKLRPRLVQFQIVFFALVIGVVILAGVTSVVGGVSEIKWPPSLLSLILGGLSVGVAIQAMVLPSIIRRAASNKPPSDSAEQSSRLSTIWFTSNLAGAGMLESCALMNVIGNMIEHNLLHLALAGLYVALMFVFFPTMNRLLDWIDANSSSR